MKTEDYERWSAIFDRFSSERNVAGAIQHAGGSIEPYQTTVRLMDKTSFILAMVEMSKPPLTETVTEKL